MQDAGCRARQALRVPPLVTSDQNIFNLFCLYNLKSNVTLRSPVFLGSVCHNENKEVILRLRTRVLFRARKTKPRTRARLKANNSFPLS